MEKENGVLLKVDKSDLILLSKNPKAFWKNVVEIDGSAFFSCVDTLTSIEIPKNVKVIGKDTFMNFKKLTSVTISKGVKTIGHSAFFGCENLTKVNLPQGLEKINDGAFQCCSKLTSIEIPKGVESLGEACFDSCYDLTSVRLPKGLKSIGNGAFACCKNLTSIDIPDSVDEIGVEVFEGCENMTSVKLPKNLKELPSGLFYGCDRLNSVTIPNGLTLIGESVFKSCFSLRSIEVPNSVKKISSEAFASCINLISVTLPKGIDEIGYAVFSGCTRLPSIDIPASVKSIGRYAFENCKRLKSVELPEAVTTICPFVFSGCTNLKTIKIPENLTTIGEYAFKNCANLASIKIPKGVNVISNGAFHNCTNLTSVKISDGVEEIGFMSFCGCENLTSIKIPDSVLKIKEQAFISCKNLQTIALPKNLERIEDKTFEDCTSLATIRIPSSVTKLGKKAFYGCKKLSNVILQDGLKEIQDSAFEKCTDLASITIPASVEKMGIKVFKDSEFKFAYKLKGSDDLILARQLPKDKEVSHYLDLNELSNVFKGFNPEDDSDLLIGGQTFEDLVKLSQVLKNNKMVMPCSFIKDLIKSGRLDGFVRSSELKFIKSEPEVDPFANGTYHFLSEDERRNYYKFMMVLGCFSSKKLLDKQGRETQTSFAQKATSLLAQILKNEPDIVGRFNAMFNTLPIDAKPNQEFLKFLGLQGDKTKFPNFEMLMELEKVYTGIFARAMSDFEQVKSFRTTLNEKTGKNETLSWEEALIKYYFSVKYNGVTSENSDIAEVFAQRGLSQATFEEAAATRAEAVAMGIKPHILDKPIREMTILESIERIKANTEKTLSDGAELVEELFSKQFTFEMLSKHDPRNLILGLDCSCCATIMSTLYGKDIAKASVKAEDVQNLVICDSKGQIVAKGTMYVNSRMGYAVFNDFEINKKYRDHETSSGIYSVATDSKDEKERDLIFDAIMRGIKAFVEEYDREHPGKPIQQVNVGMGYNRLKAQCERFKKATRNLTVPTEYNFQDASKEQRVLYDRREKDIKKGDKSK